MDFFKQALFVCGGWKEWERKKIKQERRVEIVSHRAPKTKMQNS